MTNAALNQDNLKALTLLYVEDDEDVREQLSEYLRRRVGVLLVAQNGAEGLGVYREQQPDMIITDILMPVMDGLAMAAEIRKTDFNIPIIVTTAFENSSYFMRSIEIGVDKYVTKPIDTDLLYSAIQTCANRLKIDQQLRLAHKVFENCIEAILITDANNNMCWVNPAFTDTTGYSSEEMLGKNPGVLSSGKQDGLFYQGLWAELADKGFWKGEIWNRRKNGEVYPEWLSISTLVDGRGKITNYVGIFSDITDRKRIEEQLKSYKDHLEEEVQQRTADLVLARNAAEAASKAKSAFLANMSHELRTPLNAILGFSSMLSKDTLLSVSQRQNLDIINRSGENLLSLINDALEVAKIEAGRVQLEELPFDFSAMVRDVADMMRLRAQEKGLQFLVEVSPQFPRYIVGDEARLQQILINLVGNAVKFTRQGRVVLRIGIELRETEQLLIEVEDSGPGIAQEDRQRIFEPFVQLGEHALSQGAGLGLSISRQYAQMMGGSLNLESTPGKGSVFSVELPLRKANEADIIDGAGVGCAQMKGVALGQPEYRILIIDDQQDNRLLLAKLMEGMGLAGRMAENGEQGIQLFQSWQPHLIWIDRRMPGMDGLETTRAIRQLPGGQDVKIVAVVASAVMEPEGELLAAGMDDIVHKPYRANEIHACLSRQLGVQIICQSNTPEPQEPLAILSPELLKAAPAELRHQLQAALESLEQEHIGQVLEQIGSYDQNLKAVLTRLVDNFDYPQILKALSAL